MSKIKLTLSGFMFLLLLLFGLSRVFSRNPDTKNTTMATPRVEHFKR